MLASEWDYKYWMQYVKSICNQKAPMNQTVKCLYNNYGASTWDEDSAKPNLLDPSQRNEIQVAG